MPACSTLPRITCSTWSGAIPARSSAARMAVEPRAGAGRDESFPRNEPTGVRAAERTTTFFMMRILSPGREAAWCTWTIRGSSGRLDRRLALLLLSRGPDPRDRLRGETDRAGDLGRLPADRHAPADARPQNGRGGHPRDPAV